MVLVAGKKRVPSPAAGITALRTGDFPDLAADVETDVETGFEFMTSSEAKLGKKGQLGHELGTALLGESGLPWSSSPLGTAEVWPGDSGSWSLSQSETMIEAGFDFFPERMLG